MRYHATTETIEHITQLVYQVRPGWDPALVRIILRSHVAHVDGNDLAIAALRCASNETMPGPKAIGWRGPHWRDLDTRPPEVKGVLWCEVCGKVESRCLTERWADDDHDFEPTGRPVRSGR